jgi:hypothetical protein
MSPPIRDGSGNSIGAIRLGDGSEISEVRTGAGDVLFGATTIADSALTQDLVAWYRFEDGDARDYASNAEFPNVTWGDSTAYDGTVNGVSFQPSGGVTDFENGGNSGAFQGDGTGADGITVNGISGFGNDQPHTICFWIRLDSFSGYPVFLGNDSSNNSSGIGILSSTEWNWFFFGNDIKYDPSSEISSGTYAHVALSYEGGGKDPANETFYANANPMPVVDDNSTGNTSALPDPAPFSMLFDNQRDRPEIEGEMDDIRIYNRALTQSEVSDIYNATKP